MRSLSLEEFKQRLPKDMEVYQDNHSRYIMGIWGALRFQIADHMLYEMSREPRLFQDWLRDMYEKKQFYEREQYQRDTMPRDGIVRSSGSSLDFTRPMIPIPTINKPNLLLLLLGD